MVTLALTVTVPETVDPDPGEVMVTIRLPVEGSESWARAGGGAIQIQQQITSRAAGAHLTRGSRTVPTMGPQFSLI
jgi:hypothetical protein